MNQSLPASAQHVATLTESSWLQHTNLLHELYICQNKTLNEVKRTMEEEHGFPVMRSHDYEIALREVLGLRKNMRGQDWHAIKAHCDRRQSQGKKSNVLWNGMIVDARKVRKEIRRQRKRTHFLSSRLETPPLPPGVIINTPPPSPTASMTTVVATIESPPDPESIFSAASGRLMWVRYGFPARLNRGRKFLEPIQVAFSRLHELRKECPFNVFIGKLLDFSDSYDILEMVPVECAQIPRPRLLGMNPSWELLARITFEISNNISIDWAAPNSSWFLDWFGMSADLRVLRAFFSITGPTVCAVYESLCRTVQYLRRPPAVNVVFEMLDVVRGNNPILADALNFLEIAVDIGSTSDGFGMLRIASLAIERHTQVLDGAAEGERLWLSYLIAASKRDTAMLRLLVDAGARPEFGAEFNINSPYYRLERLLELRIIYQLVNFAYGSDELNATSDFVQLLLEGGFLLVELPPRCYNSDRPKVNLLPGPISFDEAIMLSPPMKRQALYNTIINGHGEGQKSVRHAGIFTAAVGGARSLGAYVRSCKQDNEFDALATLQESLVFASCLNDTETLSALLQIGTDPSADLLQSNEQQCDKGTLPWKPMVIAAVAESKEALALLKEWSNLNTFLSFLEWVPVGEIVRQTHLNIADRGYGTELWRLDNLRRHFLYDSAVISETRSEIEIKFEESRANRLELLTWIRSIAVAHSAAAKLKVDEDILEAAVSMAPGTYHSWIRPQYCDILLLDGLVDTNFEYHKSGMNLLQLSIRNNCSLNVVRFLLSKGFKVHPGHSRPAMDTETQNTMLLDALLSSSPDRCQIVHLLLDQGADCTETGIGLTLLEASLLYSSHGNEAQDYLDIFWRLLEKGATVPSRPQRLLNLLIRAGAVDELILYIIDTFGTVQMQGTSPQTADFTWLPLVPAISQNRETLARELIRRGADVHAPAESSSHSTALQAACGSGSSLEFIKHLVVENGADVNEAPAEELGITALQSCSSMNVFDFLLDHGADLNALSGRFDAQSSDERFKFRRRALDMAAEFGRLDMLEYLLKAGGRSGYDGLRGSILLAQENGHFAVLSVLLEWERKHGSQTVQ